jgi:hypothetical protein
MIVLILLAQLSASPAPPMPVSGRRSLADVARERSLRTGNAAGTKPTPIVLDLPPPAPIPTSATHPARDLGPDYDAPSLPTTNLKSTHDLLSTLAKPAGLFIGPAGMVRPAYRVA